MTIAFGSSAQGTNDMVPLFFLFVAVTCPDLEFHSMTSSSTAHKMAAVGEEFCKPFLYDWKRWSKNDSHFQVF